MRDSLAWLGKQEKNFWILLMLVTLSLWLFMAIAAEIVAGETFTLDETLLRLMRQAGNPEHAIGPPWLEQVVHDITALGGNAVLTLVSIWVMVFLCLIKKARLAMVVLLATGGALLASLLLKSGFDRPRPDLVTHATMVYTSSFPSGHSMLAASAYLTMGALLAQTQSRKRVKALIMLSSVFLTLLIGISRVYLGVHWPTDVVAGWAAGSVWAVGCSLLARQLTRRSGGGQLIQGNSMVKLSSPVPWAKMGYAARGLIYLTIGMLAFFSAIGWQGEKTGSKGAILSLNTLPFGELLLVVLVVGLFGYVIWRLIQGITDTDNHGTSFKGLAIRSGLVISAISHGVLAYWAIKLLVHQRDDTSGQSAQSTMSEHISSDSITVLFIMIGIVVVIVGIAHLVKGFRSGFKKYIEFPADKHTWLIPICRFGLISRGVVWCIIGWIILRSTFVAGSSDNKGINDAFEWLSTTPYGSWLIIIASIGLFAFGIYSFIESFYRRIET